LPCSGRLLLTFQHRAGVRPYTSSYDFAESCVFGKQSLPPSLCHSRCREPTFSRSYGSKLQSSFAWDLSNALVYSTHSPVSVYGTDVFASSLSSFSRKQRLMRLTSSVFRLKQRGDLSTSSPYDLKLVSNTQLSLSFFTPASLHKLGAGILTCLPSTTPFGLALGPDSP
jgi:hypothetical protein